MIAGDDVLSSEEDATVAIAPASLLASERDVDGDVPRIVSVASGLGGEVELLDGGTIAFRPDGDFNGVALFTYVVSDGRGGEDTGTVAVRVDPANDPPVIDVAASILSGEVTENTAGDGTLQAPVGGRIAFPDVDAVDPPEATAGPAPAALVYIPAGGGSTVLPAGLDRPLCVTPSRSRPTGHGATRRARSTSRPSARATPWRSSTSSSSPTMAERPIRRP